MSMSRSLPGGLLELGGTPHVRVATTDDDGDTVFVSTSVYEHTSEHERETLAEAHHLYPARHDHIMTDMGASL